MSDLGDQCLAFARFEVEVLRNLLVAIRQWSAEQKRILDERSEDVGTTDYESSKEAERAQEELTGDWTLYERTERAMYGTLAVAIASTFEKFVESICQWTPLMPEGAGTFENPRPAFNQKTIAVEQKFGFATRRLPGFDSQKRARLLSNCFKHNRGRTLPDYARDLGIQAGHSIHYEKEDWTYLIDQTMVHSAAISRHLTGHKAQGIEMYDDYVGIVDVPTDNDD